MEYKQQEIKLESIQRQRIPCTKKSDGLDWRKDCAVGKATNPLQSYKFKGFAVVLIGIYEMVL